MANNENIHENTPCWGINTGLSWQKRKWMPFLQQISVFLVPGSFPLIFECNSITLKHYHLISSSLARVSFHFVWGLHTSLLYPGSHWSYAAPPEMLWETISEAARKLSSTSSKSESQFCQPTCQEQGDPHVLYLNWAESVDSFCVEEREAARSSFLFSL